MTRGWPAATVLLQAGVLAAAAAAGCGAPATAGDDARAAVDAAPMRAFWDLYRRAGAARLDGRFAEAGALYRQALAARPGHEDSLYYLGNCLLDRGHYAGALDAYERLVAANPAGSSRGYMQMALIRASLDPDAPVDLDRARELFERALALDPDSGALLGLAEVALQQRRLVEAEQLLVRVEADNPMSVAAPFLRGYLAFARHDRGAAWMLFTTAVSRVEMKKGAVTWTEEGDARTSPALRWKALARQSVFGDSWIGLRAYVAHPGATRDDMRRDYERLHAELLKRWS